MIPPEVEQLCQAELERLHREFNQVGPAFKHLVINDALRICGMYHLPLPEWVEAEPIRNAVKARFSPEAIALHRDRKLAYERRAKIHEAKAAGLTINEIAARFGVSRARVYSILKKPLKARTANETTTQMQNEMRNAPGLKS